MEDATTDRELEIQQLIEGLARTACTSLFSAYGVELMASELPPEAEDRRSLTGIVGFTGQSITGMCLVEGTEPPLEASNPGGSLRDWVAELTNQLAGRLKHKLLSEGVEVYITTPIVLRATRIEPLPRRTLRPSCFSDGRGGVVKLWIEVEIAPGFELRPGHAETPIEEGETLLF